MTLFDVLEAHKHNPKDKRVFGLVIQGGGMRAVYSAGAMVPLIAYDFSGTFDHVVGSSAGAINAAYLLDNQTDAMEAYIEDLTTKDFVNLLRKDKKIDVDFAVDTVLAGRYPLNQGYLAKSHTKMHTILTDSETGRKVVMSDHHKFAQIYEELRATSALPVLYDRPVEIDGKTYVDGGVADLLPVDVAVKLGCTDIVVVMTQQLSSYKFDRAHSRLVKHLVKKFAKNHSEALRKALPTNEKLLQQNLRLLKKPHKKIRIFLLQPSNEEELISMATIDKAKVRSLCEMAIKDMDLFLNKELAP